MEWSSIHFPYSKEYTSFDGEGALENDGSETQRGSWKENLKRGWAGTKGVPLLKGGLVKLRSIFHDRIQGQKYWRYCHF